ncbi:HAD-IA family hydrolase [Phycicoccus sp. CSK15P-2]|uniref:HAD family hydrolase n=1 Tax=Phycicoccus sp. CSK15P-2 TaxID=2807627 RepID=UPI00195016FE|nr:HAD-IA family hydrolase [Phycicoccus sp. CSK15P-2]MBM6405380.1 HAD-IA family hydrolase [Phycicoccus sp. CSK15P-2]
MSPTHSPAPSHRVFRAVLLDLDGTLVDSTPAVERSWVRWCEEFGVEPERLARQHGVPARQIIGSVLPGQRFGEALARIHDLEVADTDGVVPLPGAVELLDTLAGAGVPTAVVTSCDDVLADVRIRAAGLPRPELVVTASDVAHGKPFPDPWLVGAERLGVDPADCLVVEDAVAGLQAARDAGCGGRVALLSTTPREALEPLADLVVTDVAELLGRMSAADGVVRLEG